MFRPGRSVSHRFTRTPHPLSRHENRAANLWIAKWFAIITLGIIGLLACFAAAIAQNVPAPQIGLSGNVGAIGFPILNSGTFQMPADADVTFAGSNVNTSAFAMKVTSAVSLTTTRNLIYPAGRFYVTVENATTGGQAIQIIGPTGTGVAIANGRTVTVWNDGTNYVTAAGAAGPAGATGPAGPTGSTGPNGPNLINSSTSTSFNGLIQGNSTNAVQSDVLPSDTTATTPPCSAISANPTYVATMGALAPCTVLQSPAAVQRVINYQLGIDIPAFFPQGGYSGEKDLNVYDTTGSLFPLVQWNPSGTGGSMLNGRSTLDLLSAPGYGNCIGQWIAGHGTPNRWGCWDAFGQLTQTPANSSYIPETIMQGVSDGVYADLLDINLHDGTQAARLTTTSAASGATIYWDVNNSHTCTVANMLCYSTPITFPSGVLQGASSTAAPTASTSPQIVTALNTSPSTTLAPALLPLATTGAFGAVKPDGTTVTISGGVISAGSVSLAGPLQSALNLGDSLTQGFYSASLQGIYAEVADAYVQVPQSGINDQGISGRTCYTYWGNILTYPFTYSKAQLITLMLGTNDSTNYPSTTNQYTTFSNCETAMLMWYDLPTKINFNSGSVTYTGTWTAAADGIGKTTTGNGNTATFTGTGTVLYLITNATDSNAATATLTCDGTPTGATLNFQGVGGTTLGGNTVGQATRVSLSAGAHSCVVTKTSSGGTVSLDFAGFVNGSVTTSPVTILATTPDVYNYVAAGNPANYSSYRSAEAAIITQAISDGFANVGLANNAGAIGPFMFYDSGVHFTNYGHFLEAGPIVSAVNTILGTSFTVPNSSALYYGVAPNDVSKGGPGSMGIGVRALQNPNNTSSNTLAWGNGAMYNATGAANTIAIGVSSLSDCTTCANTEVIGGGLVNLTTSGYNIAIGENVGGGLSDSTSTDQGNIFIGTNIGAISGATGGVNDNIVLGLNAGYALAGSNNILIGEAAGFVSVTTDTDLTMIGTSTTQSAGTPITNATCIGYAAACAASNTAYIGNASVTGGYLGPNKILAPVSNAITSATGGTGTGAVTCLTATCTNLRGTYSVVGGTFTTGTFLTLVWPTTTTAYACTATMNGGTGFLGIGNSVATATGMNITNGVSILGITVTVNYSCTP